MRKRLRLPFLHQLLLTYLVALLLPVALIGRQTWVGYQRTLENEIRQTNSQLLTEIASVINMQLQGLEQIAVNLDLNEDLRPFAVTSIDTIAEGVHFELSTHSAGGWYCLGAAWVKCMPNCVQMNINELSTLVASPMNVTCRSSRRLPAGACSIMVSTSQTT